jgi:uncharacterized protein (DUF1778 family)
MRSDTEKTARVNFRVTAEQDRLLREAAALAGTSVSSFVLEPALERAHLVVESEQVTRIPRAVAAAFFEWLDRPAEVVPEMKRLANAEPFGS